MLKTSDACGALVTFDGVWKRFRRGERHDALRDLIPSLVARLVRHTGSGAASDTFWALQDVSFEVKPGMALGIIGPNGAGKSTTLKLLTKLIKPTRGSCAVRGRIGALIEVAAGFHPDLTGRENVYLQGAVMGMKRAEVARKFRSIVEFAETGDFMETPIKRFSSGMSARLGFAIAAHLDPDVLLIDEVLAVGDLAFQQRAFERIAELVRRDIPVVVVSHQLQRIATLCSHAILLEHGRVVCRDVPSKCIATYVERQVLTVREPAHSCAVVIHSIQGKSRDGVRSGEALSFLIHGARVGSQTPGAEEILIRVRSAETGEAIFSTGTGALGLDLCFSGSFAVSLELQMNVPPGLYIVETLVRDRVAGRHLAKGPHTSICVTPGRAFRGSVQMNPRAELVENESTLGEASIRRGTAESIRPQ